jgi:beta-phosphoglucomutase-like phosphatase (HAD superfamily)
MALPAACLFDLDGLLLDTEPLHGRAWREAARSFGVELSDGQLLQLRGRRRLDNAQQVIRWIQERVGAAPDAEQLLAVQQPIARLLLPTAVAMEGAPELLARCRDLAIPSALVTSSSQDAALRKGAPHPWLELLQLRVYGDDPAVSSGKPAPDGFLLAASRLGVEPHRCWAFEDSAAGAEAALAAGCLVQVLRPEAIAACHYPPGVAWLNSLADLKLN